MPWVTTLTRYKGKDNFYISKRFSHFFAKKLRPVHNPRFPNDRPGHQCPFKGRVGFPVLAQFKPMFVFCPLDEHTANPGRIAGNIRFNVHFFFVLYFSDWAFAILVAGAVNSHPRENVLCR